MTSRIEKIYKKSHLQRLKILEEFSSLTQEELTLLKEFHSISFDDVNRMVENAVSVMPLPVGVAANFLINGKDYFVPMAIEESSVIAAASYAAKLARSPRGGQPRGGQPRGGSPRGFTVSASEPIMIGQVQLLQVSDCKAATESIVSNKDKLIELANETDPVLIEVGGGARDIEVKSLSTSRGTMLVVHLLVDVRDAMGANIVNTMVERIAPALEKITGATFGARIVSNLSIHRTVRARGVWKKSELGDKIPERILDIYELALCDPFRCATHNKGILNGIDAVAIATGNDFRAIEAGAHAYASLGGTYKPLTKYFIDGNGDLVGELEMPLAVGIVGGITESHPMAKTCLSILGVTSAKELSCVMGAVGLAQNFAALRAIACEGISRGHMRLHSKNIAIAAGATKEMIDLVALRMIEEENISVSRARELVKEWIKSTCRQKRLL